MARKTQRPVQSEPARYANVFEIRSNAYKVLLVFGQAGRGMHTAICLTPHHAGLFCDLLLDALKSTPAGTRRNKFQNERRETAMKRRIRITFDPGTMTCSATYYQVDEHGKETAGGAIDYSEYQRAETYGNQLYNGELEVIEADGIIRSYGNGCHLVQHETGFIKSMSKPEYVTFSGRPGSENED